LRATKGFTGDEYAFVYRSKKAYLPGKAPEDEMDPRSKLMPSRWTADTTAVMDPSSRLMPTRWTAEGRPKGLRAAKSAGVLVFTEEQRSAGAEAAVFTEAQISKAMRQLPPVWQKDEKGYWVEAEPDEEQRARAVELLREALSKPVVSRQPRASNLRATKGFTGDEYAFVYRTKGASKPGTARVTQAERVAATAAYREQQRKASASGLSPLAFTEEQRSAGADAVFTEAQISNAMRALTPVWQKNEKGYWVDATPEEEKLEQALAILRKELAEPVVPESRRSRASGLRATKGFTGDEFAFVYRTQAAYDKETALGSRITNVRQAKKDRVSDSRDSLGVNPVTPLKGSPLDWVAPKSSDEGVVVPTGSSEVEKKQEELMQMGPGRYWPKD